MIDFGALSGQELIIAFFRGVGVPVEEQNDRREQYDCHWPNPRRKSGTVDSQAWGTLLYRTRRDSTIGQAYQGDWPSSVGCCSNEHSEFSLELHSDPFVLSRQ